MSKTFKDVFKKALKDLHNIQTGKVVPKTIVVEEGKDHYVVKTVNANGGKIMNAADLDMHKAMTADWKTNNDGDVI